MLDEGRLMKAVSPCSRHQPDPIRLVPAAGTSPWGSFFLKKPGLRAAPEAAPFTGHVSPAH
jgi:hypothetical protein